MTVTLTGALSREAFVDAHMQLIRAVAREIHLRFPAGWFEIDDLISTGIVGLLESYPRYRSGAPYKPTLVIRRAIVKSVRGSSYLSQSRRSGASCESLAGDPQPAECPVRTSEDPDVLQERMELAAMLVLTSRERLLLELHYERGLTLRGIGKRHLLDVEGPPTPPLPRSTGHTCSTVSGERTVRREYWRAIVKLRRAMKDLATP